MLKVPIGAFFVNFRIYFKGCFLVVIRTQRLIIREITNEDANNLAKVLADPIVMQYSTVGVHTKEQIDDYIANCKNQYHLNGYGHWAIYETTNDEFVGVCGLSKHKVEADDVMHINYRLTTEQQGKGYAVESVLGVLDFAKNILALNAIHALIEPANTRSVKVVSSTGFKFVKSSVFRGFTVDIYQVDL